MKLILSIVILSVVAVHSFVQIYPPRPHPKRTYVMNCGFACKMVRNNVARDDGTVDVANLERITENLPLRPHDVQVLKSILEGPCQDHKHESGDICDTAGVLYECLYNETVKRGEKFSEIHFPLVLPFDDIPGILKDPVECRH